MPTHVVSAPISKETIRALSIAAPVTMAYTNIIFRCESCPRLLGAHLHRLLPHHILISLIHPLHETLLLSNRNLRVQGKSGSIGAAKPAHLTAQSIGRPSTFEKGQARGLRPATLIPCRCWRARDNSHQRKRQTKCALCSHR